ncbi:hypothetical protein DFH06DRAFT_1306214, partial [Mycena polygramma]
MPMTAGEVSRLSRKHLDSPFAAAKCTVESRFWNPPKSAERQRRLENPIYRGCTLMEDDEKSRFRKQERQGVTLLRNPHYTSKLYFHRLERTPPLLYDGSLLLKTPAENALGMSKLWLQSPEMFRTSFRLEYHDPERYPEKALKRSPPCPTADTVPLVNLVLRKICSPQPQDQCRDHQRAHVLLSLNALTLLACGAVSPPKHSEIRHRAMVLKSTVQ